MSQQLTRALAMTMASPMPPLIAATAQRRRQLLLQHRLDETADAAAQTGLDRVKPSLTCKQPLGARRCRAILVHGVVSPGAPTPGFGCRASTGDYVTPFPTTSRTGPIPDERTRAARQRCGQMFDRTTYRGFMIVKIEEFVSGHLRGAP